MTDDFSPLEYSWNWDTPKTSPKIRYSFELIGPTAGRRRDSFNQEMIPGFVSTLASVFPDIDWQWFNALSEAFCDTSSMKSPKRLADTASSSSSVFFAFELGRKIAMKAYFVPVKAEQVGCSRLQVLSEAVESLKGDQFEFPAYSYFINFVETTPEGSELETIGAAIDCIDPKLSRLKLYMRSPRTSFGSVCTIMSMNEEVTSFNMTAREELFYLWCLVLGLDESFSRTEELPRTEHLTAGVLYNFDIKQGNAKPDTKIYIPVRHYGKNDLAIAEGLGTYLRKKGRDRFVGNYMRALEGICAHRPLEGDCGLHTYISCAIAKDGSLSLTSYFSAEIYHVSRWK